MFKKFLEGNFFQGEWVSAKNVQGVFIAKISQNESVIAGYNNKEKKYLKINNSTIKKCEGKDADLLSFAKKHILWHHYEKFDRKGSKDKEIRRKAEK